MNWVESVKSLLNQQDEHKKAQLAVVETGDRRSMELLERLAVPQSLEEIRDQIWGEGKIVKFLSYKKINGVEGWSHLPHYGKLLDQGLLWALQYGGVDREVFKDHSYGMAMVTLSLAWPHFVPEEHIPEMEGETIVPETIKGKKGTDISVLASSDIKGDFSVAVIPEDAKGLVGCSMVVRDEGEASKWITDFLVQYFAYHSKDVSYPRQISADIRELAEAIKRNPKLASHWGKESLHYYLSKYGS